ncbi:MAG: hypothetical protein ACE5JH_00375 [Acidobacteriota bacterium]
MNPRLRRTIVLPAACAAALTGAAGTARAGEGKELNLFQMVARSELVVHARVREGALRFAIVDLVETLKGEPPAPSLRIAFREFNFNRRRSTEPIVFPDGQDELLFLVPYEGVNRNKEKNRDIYALLRGPSGRFTLPAEGPSIILDAVRSFVDIARQPPASQLGRLVSLLEDDNPYRVETALEEILRLRAGRPDLFVRLLPLLSDPSGALRLKALDLIAQIFRDGAGTVLDQRPDEARGTLAAVIERARNDKDAAVRARAVTAIASWPERGEVEPELRAIARLDPAQSVRYEAERALFLAGRKDGGSGRGPQE